MSHGMTIPEVNILSADDGLSYQLNQPTSGHGRYWFTINHRKGDGSGSYYNGKVQISAITGDWDDCRSHYP